MSDGGAAAGVFGDRAGQWASWQSSPWGRLRYAVARETTARAIAALPGRLRVLDVGGGDGADSLPLAEDGHDVTVLDFAPELLMQAQEAAGRRGVADRVRVVRADLDDLMTGAGDEPLGTFDVVLCHNVLHYRADVPATVRWLARLARADGVVSVMAPNPAMDVLSAAVRRQDPAGALAVLDSPTVHGETFDHPMRRLGAAEAEEALTDAGCTVQHRFGIRCVMDLIADDERKSEPAFYEQLLDLELRLCEREPYWRTARFWQLTASTSS
ncbi:S-adenosylmethionine-dependent methyltransferase [Blastococcus aurantiacus]|uniref:S-adenosylmethionine-dependent methyltransferase n=1 Tax=Blastococcus aurantiacus TaxID=1550231 RepID=A0A1G7NRY5_9ACTN|nr:methyltransferase domain-containing protein [Blastococcus aurantiacus]SDF76835.1 S-adenosylmethionine-dependent methyltransferase [Blastococcus aurantiacus]